MRLFRKPPIRLQPYFGYRSESRLIIAARALKGRPARFRQGGRLRALRTMLSQFASREVADLPVWLKIEQADGKAARHEILTDAEGFAHFDIALDPPRAMAAQTVWEVVRFGWSNREGPQEVRGHVLVPGAERRLAVISDIDDTIIETGITGGLGALLRNWRRLLAELPHDRIAVAGADEFYAELGGGQIGPPAAHHAGDHVPATHRPFFYISSSPWNLFSYLVAFQRAKGLPLGPLMLRDWGLNRATLGRSSHGAHKRESIAKIMETYPQMRFALIGDDTQGDLPAYAEAVRRDPARVAAIFIRRAATAPLSPEEAEARKAIETAGVPLWLGDGYAVGEDFLRAAGFTPGGETERIVRTVEQMPDRGGGA